MCQNTARELVKLFEADLSGLHAQPLKGSHDAENLLGLHRAALLFYMRRFSYSSSEFIVGDLTVPIGIQERIQYIHIITYKLDPNASHGYFELFLVKPPFDIKRPALIVHPCHSRSFIPLSKQLENCAVVSSEFRLKLLQQYQQDLRAVVT